MQPLPQYQFSTSQSLPKKHHIHSHSLPISQYYPPMPLIYFFCLWICLFWILNRWNHIIYGPMWIFSFILCEVFKLHPYYNKHQYFIFIANSITLYANFTFCVSIYYLISIWVVSTFWLSWIMLLGPFVCKSSHGYNYFLSHIYLQVELLGLMDAYCSSNKLSQTYLFESLQIYCLIVLQVMAFTEKNPRCQQGWVPFESYRRKACFSKFWSPLIFLSSCAHFPSSSRDNSMVLSVFKSSASLHIYNSPCL